MLDSDQSLHLRMPALMGIQKDIYNKLHVGPQRVVDGIRTYSLIRCRNCIWSVKYVGTLALLRLFLGMVPFQGSPCRMLCPSAFGPGRSRTWSSEKGIKLAKRRRAIFDYADSQITVTDWWIGSVWSINGLFYHLIEQPSPMKLTKIFFRYNNIQSFFQMLQG